MEAHTYYLGKGDQGAEAYERQDKHSFLKGLLGGNDGRKASPKAAQVPTSVPKKFMDMISPLLMGSNSSTSAVNSPMGQAQQHATPQHATPQHATPQHATPQHATPQHATPQQQQPMPYAPKTPASGFAKAAAAIQQAAAHDGSQPACPNSNMERTVSYNSGLTEYVNKMKISEAGGNGAAPGSAAAAGKRSKLSNESSLSSSSSVSAMSVQSSRSAGPAPAAPAPAASLPHPHQPSPHHHALPHAHPHAASPFAYSHASPSHPHPHAQPAPLSAAHSPNTPLNPHAYTSNLDRLLDAARNCQLPQSGRPLQPMPADPMADPHPGPTIPLVMSPNLPPRMQRHAWRLSDYQLGEKLYTGYASTVYKAVCRASGEVVVLKIYHLMSVCDLYKYQIYREVRVHSNLSHENIVHLLAAFQEGNKVILVQEYADGADLFTLLHKYGGRLSERLAVQLVLEPFLRVLQYLHSRAIIHRDIKPENILFSKAMCLKLGDFGLAIDLREERAVTRAGTLDYMAPEVLRCPFKSRPEENKDNERLHYSARVDAWAVGVLTYELLVGFPPFFDQSRTSTEERIVHSMPAFPAGMSEEAKAFITSALSKHAAERPTILEMLHHPWIARYSSRRSMRLMTPGGSVPASPMQGQQAQHPMSPSAVAPTPRRPAPALPQQSSLQSAGSSQPATPLRPPAPAPSSGFPTLGALLGSMPPALSLAEHGKMGAHAAYAPPSPSSPLVMKESSELSARFSHGSSNASMQM